MAERERVCCMRFNSWFDNKFYQDCFNIIPNTTQNIDSLLDISAKIVAENIPFQVIEERYNRIPEPVQRKIVFWSFPRDEKEICMYSSLARVYTNSNEYQSLPFQKGIKLLEMGCVENVLQVGFHLSGLVTSSKTRSFPLAATIQAEPEKKYKVTVSFDRCKITSVTCTCDTKDIFWCHHVVALSLFRIRHPHKVQLRVPISETLLQMDRVQLQKFVQYLISEHHTEVLPTAQKLADDILKHKSEINQIRGAPDPTAGSSADADHTWHLDEQQVCEQVRMYLSQGGYYNAGRNLHSMFAKIREMLRARDSNGARMLTLITEEFLADAKLYLWKSQGTPMTDKYRQLWDLLGGLWVCVVLNPRCTTSEKQHWNTLLSKWSSTDICPLEDPDSRPLFSNNIAPNDENISEDEVDDSLNVSFNMENNNNCNSQYVRPRTIFNRALDALSFDWKNEHLKHIRSGLPSSSSCCMLSSLNSNSLPPEDLPTASARVDALRSHGYMQEALRLAVAIIRNMKHEQLRAQQQWQACLRKKDTHQYSNYGMSVSSSHTICNLEGWIGHSLDPIGCLFDTLTEACLLHDEQPFDFDLQIISDSGAATSISPHYHHVPVPISIDYNESYLTLALEAALIGLGQQRIMPAGMYAQEKSRKQEEQLISKLQTLEMDGILVSVLRRQCILLLEGGPSSSLGQGINPESVPMHTFAKYLFNTLLPYDADLAYAVGLRAMRLPVLEEHDDTDDPVNGSVSSVVLSRYPRWFTLAHIESQQCALGSAMLNAAKNDSLKLRSILECCRRNIHSSSHLFKLAQDAFRFANPPEGFKHMPLLKAALELGLQLMQMTLNSLNWRRRDMVRWLVTCATEVGFEALMSIMQNWQQLFTPTEATGSVANTIMSHPTLLKLNLDYQKQKELSNCARALALQCANKDAPNCALNALTLCENEPMAFETAYQIVIDAASQIMTSLQLFTIAKYMQQRGYHHRAYKLSMLAMKSIHLAYNQDTHPTIHDIHWACSLSLSLGKMELTNMIPLIIKNVQCATVLSDVLRRCSLTAPGAPCTENKRRCLKPLPYDRPPLRPLLDAAISAYITTTNSRLTHISPRHYTDFIDFLTKAQETFHLSQDGPIKFAQLLENMKTTYKGKKKLMNLVKERFGI